MGSREGAIEPEEARCLLLGGQYGFGDPMELTIYDPDHSEGEYCFLSVGRSSNGRLLVVSYTEREENRIRIINARPATVAEMKRYESES
jgi:uncharacterized DUF497 family protein